MFQDLRSYLSKGGDAHSRSENWGVGEGGGAVMLLYLVRNLITNVVGFSSNHCREEGKFIMTLRRQISSIYLNTESQKQLNPEEAALSPP